VGEDVRRGSSGTRRERRAHIVALLLVDRLSPRLALALDLEDAVLLRLVVVVDAGLRATREQRRMVSSSSTGFDFAAPRLARSKLHVDVEREEGRTK